MRIVRTPDGEVCVDPSGRMNGRGAYLCRNPECLVRAQKTGALARALRCAVPENIYGDLKEEVADDVR